MYIVDIWVLRVIFYQTNLDEQLGFCVRCQLLRHEGVHAHQGARKQQRWLGGPGKAQMVQLGFRYNKLWKIDPETASCRSGEAILPLVVVPVADL